MNLLSTAAASLAGGGRNTTALSSAVADSLQGMQNNSTVSETKVEGSIMEDQASSVQVNDTPTAKTDVAQSSRTVTTGLHALEKLLENPKGVTQSVALTTSTAPTRPISGGAPTLNSTTTDTTSNPIASFDTAMKQQLTGTQENQLPIMKSTPSPVQPPTHIGHAHTATSLRGVKPAGVSVVSNPVNQALLSQISGQSYSANQHHAWWSMQQTGGASYPLGSNTSMGAHAYFGGGLSGQYIGGSGSNEQIMAAIAIAKENISVHAMQIAQQVYLQCKASHMDEISAHHHYQVALQQQLQQGEVALQAQKQMWLTYGMAQHQHSGYPQNASSQALSAYHQQEQQLQLQAFLQQQQQTAQYQQALQQSQQKLQLESTRIMSQVQQPSPATATLPSTQSVAKPKVPSATHSNPKPLESVSAGDYQGENTNLLKRNLLTSREGAHAKKPRTCNDEKKPKLPTPPEVTARVEVKRKTDQIENKGEESVDEQTEMGKRNSSVSDTSAKAEPDSKVLKSSTLLTKPEVLVSVSKPPNDVKLSNPKNEEISQSNSNEKEYTNEIRKERKKVTKGISTPDKDKSELKTSPQRPNNVLAGLKTHPKVSSSIRKLDRKTPKTSSIDDITQKGRSSLTSSSKHEVDGDTKTTNRKVANGPRRNATIKRKASSSTSRSKRKTIRKEYSSSDEESESENESVCNGPEGTSKPEIGGWEEDLVNTRIEIENESSEWLAATVKYFDQDTCAFRVRYLDNSTGRFWLRLEGAADSLDGLGQLKWRQAVDTGRRRGSRSSNRSTSFSAGNHGTRKSVREAAKVSTKKSAKLLNSLSETESSPKNNPSNALTERRLPVSRNGSENDGPGKSDSSAARAASTSAMGSRKPSERSMKSHSSGEGSSDHLRSDGSESDELVTGKGDAEVKRKQSGRRKKSLSPLPVAIRWSSRRSAPVVRFDAGTDPSLQSGKGSQGKNKGKLQASGASRDSGFRAPKGKLAVGWSVKIYWPNDRCFYDGTVAKYDPDNGRHLIHYDDGEYEKLKLSSQRVKWFRETDERWLLVEPNGRIGRGVRQQQTHVYSDSDSDYEA